MIAPDYDPPLPPNRFPWRRGKPLLTADLPSL
jgi:hypothetical protein